ncbi:MAG: tetratricopeptide repeat protein [Sulfurimonas sp.]|uniref:tetratricopeptide repeat protein n=1 Tax=Sulfurimonas sp. TaxID=2022749 RepID=UPI00261041D4|nr:tetratricopeptide repeat protein [Sulfurimonas sp.]MCW8896190.1 tetratricopeptide repeat protein [Sulfurimonas sp.]MCW8954286.1 tetratricopeptide repeat protein [Sulfurimonas sp.]MCW9068430.1 tetratricopeptide repeat protein [Sulfurimonas sp.]
MNVFFIEFRDPLFGIIVFFVLVFVITFFSYWLARFKRKEDHRHLDKFLKQFNTLPSQSELKVLITKGELSEKSWLLLAHSYAKNGNYEKSIEIYNELLKVGDKANYRDTMFLLGKTYFKAGFLERARQIFLEILKNNPRTPQALNYLLLVYEYMRDYPAALEILEPLEELKKDIKTDSAYLKSLILLNDLDMSTDVKVQKLLEIYKQTNQLTYLIFEYIFRVNPKLAWENFDISKAELLVDILWNIDKKDLNFDIIMQNSYLRELYTAKGYIQKADKSSTFELDVLININKSVNATLSFEYICNSCKQVFPFAFNRCSSCHAIDTSRVELSLVKDYHKDFSEENNSFQ